MEPGTLLTLEIEKPAVGGRMIGRSDGQVVLVAGAIPGERVRARVEKVGHGLLLATVVDTLTAAPTRRAIVGDPACGGLAYAHIAYEHQVRLKSQVIADALYRIGRIPTDAPVQVVASPEHGYRLRARFHVRNGQVGWFREGTHDLCRPASNGQIAATTFEVVDALVSRLDDQIRRDVDAVEVSENLPASERVLHLTPREGRELATPATLAPPEGVTGITAARGRAARVASWWGTAWVSDRIDDLASRMTTAPDAPVRRHASSFFQANRYLVKALADGVLSHVPDGPLIDLYAGVGLFALAAAGRGHTRVVAVESDPLSASDLVENARPFGRAVRVAQAAVEAYLARPARAARGATLIVDPPRTGISRGAMMRILAAASPAIIYVSCDVATLARDLRRLLDAGYHLGHLEGFDLFPNTAHVETLAMLTK